MKNLLKFIFVFSFFINIAWAYQIEDDSILKELNKNEVKDLQADFHLKTFKSCQDMQEIMKKYIKDYWELNKRRYYWGPHILYKNMGADIALDEAPIIEKSSNSIKKTWWAIIDYSKTNIQVNWVDEADIIKTDWNYIYYYNSKWDYNDKKYVYIIDAKDPKKLKIIKKIIVPSFFNNTQLYISKNRLIILANWYSENNYKNYWINRNKKTYVIIYDISSKEHPVLKKLYLIDWSLAKSRKIWKYLYVISTNYFNIPYYSFKKEDDIDFEIKNILPKKIDISKTNDKSKQNLKLRWKTYPFNVKAWSVAKCNEIEYILPDKETLKKYDFHPSYNIISIIDTENTESEVKTKVIAGNSNEIYMSLDNLYLTSKLYSTYTYKCPAWAMCIMPYYYWWTTNTLVHKLNISWNNLNYQTSNIIPWTPLNQYSMDEKDGFFRIITTTNRWSSKSNISHTDLYILDKNLKLYSSVNNIWEKENFQSSRFMGDKLFLVTFKQIDPLFIIDLKDQKNPKIIWELKIPGYSRYLHPYDENHLIGLGYDTYENKWGWTRNWWLKIDLYEVNYDKKDSKNKNYIEIKQLYSLVLGDSWSRTEAMDNPRMFMWNKTKKLLLLPATLYKNESKDSYKHIDFFQGLIAINIDKNFWISEKYRITHINKTWIEDQRKKDCEKYTKKVSDQKKCRKLLDWTDYCSPERNYYIPEYCFADSSIWAYIASKYWNFKDSFINRALWIWNTSFAISNNKISSHNLENWSEIWDILLK